MDTPQPSQYAPSVGSGGSGGGGGGGGGGGSGGGAALRSIRLSCDRHLLAAAHTSITLSPVLAVLKVG